MYNLVDDDSLSRFAYDRKKHLRSDGTVHHSLLKPKVGDALSVYHTTGMSHSEICDHGHRYADDLVKGRIHFGYVLLSCRDVRDEGLLPNYDNTRPRHVSIPFGTDDQDARLALAKALAARVSAKARADGIRDLHDCST